MLIPKITSLMKYFILTEYPDETYFTQLELLERVPDLFLIIGGICAGLQLLGSIFLP